MAKNNSSSVEGSTKYPWNKISMEDPAPIGEQQQPLPSLDSIPRKKTEKTIKMGLPSGEKEQPPPTSTSKTPEKRPQRRQNEEKKKDTPEIAGVGEASESNVEEKKEEKEEEEQEKVEEEEQEVEEKKEPLFAVGDRIILQNLKKNPSLNGLKGTILKARLKNKFDIKLDNGDGRNNISCKYLKKTRPRVTKKSSYYFFKSTDAEQAKQYQPKKISKEKIKKEKKKKEAKKPGVSAWNRGGTWEDRDLESWSHKKIRSLFSNLKVDADHDTSDIIMDVDEVSGEASVIYARGSPRIGFDLKIKGTVTGEYCDKEVNAKFEIMEMDENNFKEGDYEFEILNVPSAIRSKLLKACRPVVHKTFETFVEEMRKESCR